MQLGIMTTVSHIGDLDYWLTANGKRFDAMLFDIPEGISPNGGKIFETMAIDLPDNTPTFKVVIYPDGRPELLWGQDMTEVIEGIKTYNNTNQ